MPVSGAPLSGALNPLSSRTRKQEARKSLLSLRQLQTFSRTPSRLAVVRQPLQAVFTPPTPVLSLGSTDTGASAPIPRPPRRVSRQASRAGECCSAPILCAGVSPLCPPHPCCCALLRGSEAFPLRHPQSPPVKGLLVCGNLSSFTAPSHWCRSRPYSFVSVFSFALPRYVGSFLPFGRSEAFCQRSAGVL